MRKDLKRKKKITKTALYEETGKALGTSVRSVWRVVNEFDKDNQIVSPKKRNIPNPFPKVDGFDLDAIRRIVHDFYKANESPTLKKIHVKICVKFLLKLDFGTENEAGNEFFMNVEILSAGGRSI